MSPYRVACHDMVLDKDFHPLLINKEEDILEFLNKDNTEDDENTETTQNNIR